MKKSNNFLNEKLLNQANVDFEGSVRLVKAGKVGGRG